MLNFNNIFLYCFSLYLMKKIGRGLTSLYVDPTGFIKSNLKIFLINKNPLIIRLKSNLNIQKKLFCICLDDVPSKMRYVTHVFCIQNVCCFFLILHIYWCTCNAWMKENYRLRGLLILNNVNLISNRKSSQTLLLLLASHSIHRSSIIICSLTINTLHVICEYIYYYFYATHWLHTHILHSIFRKYNSVYCIFWILSCDDFV